jgi:hypothetical protein
VRRLTTGIHSEKCVVRRFVNSSRSSSSSSSSSKAVVRRLTTGIHSEESVVRRFHRFADIIQCNYTNLDSTVWPTTHLGYMV